MKLLVLLTVLIVFISGCTSQFNQVDNSGNQSTSEQPSQANQSPPQPTGSGALQGEVTPPSLPTVYTINITSSGFAPKSLTIKSGDIVTFTNKDNAPHWPASDMHPTHNVYPEKGGCIGSKFDACKGLSNGELYSFTFTYSGHWCYHDHLNPVLTGCIDMQ